MLIFGTETFIVYKIVCVKVKHTCLYHVYDNIKLKMNKNKLTKKNDKVYLSKISNSLRSVYERQR